MPNLDTYLNQTPIFESYAVKCVPKKGYQKDVSKEV